MRFSQGPREGCDSGPDPIRGTDIRKTISYKVTFRREGLNIETPYWTGSLEETQELARRIAFRWGADDFQIEEFTSNEEEQQGPNSG
jgi:hypothetical protein